MVTMRGETLGLGVLWLFEGFGSMVMIFGDSVLSGMAVFGGLGLGPPGPPWRRAFVVPGIRPSLLSRWRCCVRNRGWCLNFPHNQKATAASRQRAMGIQIASLVDVGVERGLRQFESNTGHA